MEGMDVPGYQGDAQMQPEFRGDRLGGTPRGRPRRRSGGPWTHAPCLRRQRRDRGLSFRGDGWISQKSCALYYFFFGFFLLGIWEFMNGFLPATFADKFGFTNCNRPPSVVEGLR